VTRTVREVRYSRETLECGREQLRRIGPFVKFNCLAEPYTLYDLQAWQLARTHIESCEREISKDLAWLRRRGR
jgi:hypothetical protein